MTRCASCASEIPPDLAVVYCPYCGQLLNSRALVEAAPAVEVLPPDAADTPRRRRPTFVPAPLPQRPVPAVDDPPPPQPTYAPPPPQPTYAPPLSPAQPIEIHVTQTQGGSVFSSCFTTLGMIVFFLFLVPFLCAIVGLLGSP